MTFKMWSAIESEGRAVEDIRRECTVRLRIESNETDGVRRTE